MNKVLGCVSITGACASVVFSRLAWQETKLGTTIFSLDDKIGSMEQTNTNTYSDQIKAAKEEKFKLHRLYFQPWYKMCLTKIPTLSEVYENNDTLKKVISHTQ